ncbi:MAG: leucine/isoleucine/valine transporter permease subunit [Chloroflexota bacterium]|nr:leucine/isoleucine/valine transporter permease subunit [Chloroflexota bacterium]MDE2911214.1 leucine/isoleucine/valine transporter permease subunit [Chloroflexota bacterium]
MDHLRSPASRTVLTLGLLSGAFILFTGAVGMIAAFHEREVVDRFISLGQLTLLAAPFVTAYYSASRLREYGGDLRNVLIAGAGVGLLTALPSITLLLFNSDEFRVLLFLTLRLAPIVAASAIAWGRHRAGAETQTVIGIWLLVAILVGIVTYSFALIFEIKGDLRTVLVNIDRDWVEVITFENRNDLMRGIGTFGFVSVASGLAGSVLYLMPTVPRRALIYGLGITTLIGAFGETARLILQENVDRDTLREIFRRDTLRQNAALALFVISTAAGFLWALYGRQARERFGSIGAAPRRTLNRVGLVIFVAFMLMLPWLIGRTLSDVAVTIGIFVLMGLGLNIAIGLAGLLDLGYVTNYAVGAYFLAVLTSIGPLGLFKGTFTFWMVIPIALLAAMFAGFIFAVPVLRMRGDYLAIATLGFGEIIGKLAISDWLKPLIGGAQGVQAIPKPLLLGTELKNPEQLYYIVLVACLFCLFVSIRLNNSRTGRQWMAIREDEDVATAMGIDTARAKLLAFTLSAATGGVAGAIFAAKVGTVFPNSFTVFISINVLSLIIVGGIASNPGIVVGAIVLIGMPELLREFSEFRFLLYGALLILMMIKRPQGLIPSKIVSHEHSSGIKAKLAAAE